MTRNFVCHVQMSKYMYKYKCQNICIKNQDIYLLKSYTSVSSKRSKAILRFLPNVQRYLKQDSENFVTFPRR